MSYSLAAVRELLAPHLTEPEALAVGAALINSVLATEQVMAGKADAGVGAAVAAMLVDFSFALGRNPFWQRWSAYLIPVFGSAVMARLDSYAHGSGRPDQINQVAHVASAAQVVELAVAVQFCMNGARDGASVRLRTAVLEGLQRITA